MAAETVVAPGAAAVGAAELPRLTVGPAPVTHAEPAIEKTHLANGIRIVTERMPEARSVTTGFWVGAGARDEPVDLAGTSHFLEHLLFKGTESRSARQIAEAVDAVGGEMNAFTAREHTAYYTRLPDHELGLGLDLLCDVLSAPAFRPNEIEAERQVIIEEILMTADEPADHVYTLLAEALFPDHPLGREVLGTEETISAMSREDIAGFFAGHYGPANLVVAAAGNLEHDDVVAGLEQRFDGDGAPAVAVERRRPTVAPVPLTVVRRPTEQVHLALGWWALDRHDPDRHVLAVANQVLGGGMASRLFQEVREERGLAYSVYSHLSSYSDTGVLTIYAGTGPKRVGELLDVLDAEIGRLCATDVPDAELAVAKGYLAGSLVLGLEDSGGRMNRLGSEELGRGQVLTVDEHLGRLRVVTAGDVRRVAERVLSGPRSLAAVGPVPNEIA
ncbi:pitrilysin family protein [soil metagenome]